VGLDDFDVIVSGDDTVEKKPHPAPMLHGLRAAEAAASRNGDGRRLGKRRAVGACRGLPGDRRREPDTTKAARSASWMPML